MSGHTILCGSLLILGVGIQGLCCLGLLLSRNVYDRLHFLAPASTLGPLVIAAAVIGNHASAQNVVKAVLIVLLFWIINPVLTHATARAARVREFGNLKIHEDEKPSPPVIHAPSPPVSQFAPALHREEQAL